MKVSRFITLVVPLVVGCATPGTHPVATVSVPHDAIDARIAESARQQLSVGADSRRAVTVARPEAPARRQLGLLDALAGTRSKRGGIEGLPKCAALVMPSVPQAPASMPTVRTDMSRIEKMPVTPGACAIP